MKATAANDRQEERTPSCMDSVCDEAQNLGKVPQRQYYPRASEGKGEK